MPVGTRAPHGDEAPLSGSGKERLAFLRVPAKLQQALAFLGRNACKHVVRSKGDRRWLVVLTPATSATSPTPSAKAARPPFRKAALTGLQLTARAERAAAAVL